MAKVVYAELKLEPVLGSKTGGKHDPGVVDQKVEPGIGLSYLVGCSTHRRSDERSR